MLYDEGGHGGLVTVHTNGLLQLKLSILLLGERQGHETINHTIKIAHKVMH